MDRSRLLTVEDERLLLCARIVREGTEPFALDAWARFNSTQPCCGYVRCAVGDYCLKSGADLTFRDGRPWPTLASGEEDWDAVEKHFALASWEATYLFQKELYGISPTRTEVADRIEDFVNQRVSARVAAA